MIVLDTHVWVWWVSGVEPLSPKARRTIRAAVDQKAVYISSISVWEVAQLVARSRLQLTMEVTDWVAKSEALPFVHFIPVDNVIALKSLQLPGSLHPDPADRIIIATALTLGFPLVTRDEKITRYPHIRTVWQYTS
ncbi:MAG TPA: type II toxin-antitoxin system VapC family toxin [Thermodesulfobacteriota bacterium]|nr:type II toxin-antitoxin system VapC family toxin [Thermodesulfobacteriota bacterium]